ncbi:MAG TPA: site-specific integrase [Bacteroidia bacterium]|nr:site-specific integrase [Bacteroidia bacterium]
MSSIKIIYRKDKSNNNNEHPLYLRITKHRKSKYISLQIYLKPEHWDIKESRVKKSHPNSQKLNHYIRKKVSDAEGVILEMETNNRFLTPQKIKDHIMGHISDSFIKFAERNLVELENNKQFATLDKACSVLSKIKAFLKGNDLRFDEITVNWLKNYELYLRVELNNKTNTVYSNLKVIRKLINAAISEEIFPQEKNPFVRFKFKWESVKKEYLTEDELLALEQLKLESGSRKDHHRNMYVFSAYVGGLRISDVLQLRWKNFDGEKIIVQTQKTGSVISIKLPFKSIEMLMQYKREEQQPDDFIFPIFKKENDYSDKRVLFRAISSATAYTNSDLKDFEKILGFNKHIHFHTSRHTWATRALMKGIRIEYVSKLMGHKSIKTTQIYTKIINEELDKAMEVFN